jgi:hypothetical protein
MFSARVRHIVAERFGEEGIDWHLLNINGIQVIASLPYSIVFHNDEDASIFRLIYENESDSSNT